MSSSQTIPSSGSASADPIARRENLSRGPHRLTLIERLRIRWEETDKTVSKKVDIVLRERREAVTQIAQLQAALRRARPYVADHQESQPDDETRDDLAEVDAALANAEERS